jgi:hypothetical protein
MFLTVTSSARLAASLDWTTLIPAVGIGTILGSVTSSLIAPHFQYQRERALRRDDDARRLRDRKAEQLRSRLATIVSDARMSFELAATLITIPAPEVPERLRAMADRRAESISRAAAEIGAMQLDLESAGMADAVGRLLSDRGATASRHPDRERGASDAGTAAAADVGLHGVPATGAPPVVVSIRAHVVILIPGRPPQRNPLGWRSALRPLNSR